MHSHNISDAFKLGDRKWNVFPSDGHNLICKARSCAQREGEIERYVRVEKIHTVPLYCVEEAQKENRMTINAYIHVIHVYDHIYDLFICNVDTRYM